MGRLEFWLPRYNSLLGHVRKYCPNQTRAARKQAQGLYLRIRDLNYSVYRNPADFGSVYEETAYPKYTQNDDDLLRPGSAAPAQIFAAHEQSLLKIAKTKRKRRQEARNKLDRIAGPSGSRHTEEGVDADEGDEVDSSETEVSEPDDQGKGHADIARKRERLDLQLEKRHTIDENLLYNPDSSNPIPDMPDGRLSQLQQCKKRILTEYVEQATLNRRR